jgi:hypothetical protein
MPAFNSNNAYLSINSRVVADPDDATEKVFKSFSMSKSTGDENVTGGAGTEWEDHAGKLQVINGTIMIIYDTDRINTDIAAIADISQQGNVVPIVWGPEGDVSGKLKHDQDFLITQIKGPEVAVDKPLVTIEMTVISSGTPRSNLYDGDTWS